MSGRLRTVWLRDAAYDIENSFPATCSLIIEAAQEIDDLRDHIETLERDLARRPLPMRSQGERAALRVARIITTYEGPK